MIDYGKTVIICGGRDLQMQLAHLDWLNAMDNALAITTVVHGGARGADEIGAMWAYCRQKNVICVNADWSLGKMAGHIRNEQMLKEHSPHAVLAFPGGRGTAHMEGIAIRNKVPVYLYDSLEEIPF